MAATTGIELGPDSCVLAGVRPAGTVLDVSAVHVIEPAAWPLHDVALAETLKAARRGKRFPRSARVIAWGLPEPLSPDDPVVRAALRPISAAGFRIDAVLSPPQALACLAAQRPRTAPGTTLAWLAINTHGAAIAIVRDGRVLFSRTFDWIYRKGEPGSKAELLQRYSLVAHLAPEVRQAIATVRKMHGAIVEAAVTCGDLPDLRSLTMPLIEELDLEVETLDSQAGLRPRGRARDSRFAELAPTIRLACAAATVPAQRKRPVVAFLRAAAVIACGVGIGLAGYAYWAGALGDSSAKNVTTPSKAPAAPARPASSQAKRLSTIPPNPPSVPVKQAPPPAPAPATSAAKQALPPPSPMTKATAAVTKQMPPAPQQEPAALAARAAKEEQPPVSKPAAKPATTVMRAEPPPASKPAPATAKVEQPPARPAAPILVPKQEPPAPVKPKPQPEPVTSAPVAVAPPTEPVRQQAERPTAPDAPVPPPAPPRERPRIQVPLKDRLPRVDSILIDQERRLAIIDGEIVSVGDAVGQRVVAQIETRFVILREPSGLAVRVSLRPGILDQPM